MYIFNKVTVMPQLPKKINELDKISNNLWWSWNTEFLRLFKMIDRDLWETCEKNPVKFFEKQYFNKYTGGLKLNPISGEKEWRYRL